MERLKEVCEPVFLLGWQDEALHQEFAALGEVHTMVRARWGVRYEQTRGILNVWHQNRMASSSAAIRERRADLDRKLKDSLRRKFSLRLRTYFVRLPGMLKRLRAKEADLFWRDTNAKAVAIQIKRLRIDGVFCLTPFIPDEEMTVRVCSIAGIPVCAAILSFDNITTRPWMPMAFDSFLLWNRHNEQQLRRGYPEASASTIKIVGSPQFDFYWDRNYLMSEAEWRTKLGIPADRPVILMGGGYFTCAPHEPQYLEDLDEAIESGEIEGRPIVLFRRHPVDPIHRWESLLKKAKHVVYDDPWAMSSKILGHTNILTADIVKLTSTLYHSVLHVNVASTMSVDGAILDRPQIGPAYDDNPGHKYHRAAYECYEQEHFRPILESGGLTVARSRTELIEAVNEALRDPTAKAEGRKKLVLEMCTFDDGQCTQRVLDAATEFVGKCVPARVHQPQPIG